MAAVLKWFKAAIEWWSLAIERFCLYFYFIKRPGVIVLQLLTHILH